MIFCLDDLSIGVRRGGCYLKSPTIVLLWISPFMSVKICHIYWGAPMLGKCTFTIFIYLQLLYLLGFTVVIYNYYTFLDWSLDHYVMSFFDSCYSLCFKVCFVWCKYFCPGFLFISIYMEYLFPSPHFQSLCVFRSKVNLL